jgi:hypothetical protein
MNLEEYWKTQEKVTGMSHQQRLEHYSKMLDQAGETLKNCLDPLELYDVYQGITLLDDRMNHLANCNWCQNKLRLA